MLLRNRDFWSGLVFLLFGVVLIVFLIPSGVVEPKRIKFAVLSPSYYPRIIAIAMSLIGLAICIGSLKGKDDDFVTSTVDLYAMGKVVTVFIVLFATAYALPHAGFVLASAVALVVLMALAGERNPFIVVGVAIILPIVLYFFFTKLASVPIPGGILDPILQRI